MEDQTVSLGRYIWASPYVHAISVARGKANTPLYQLRCLRKGRRFTKISPRKIFLATRPDLLLRSRLPFDELSWRERDLCLLRLRTRRPRLGRRPILQYYPALRGVDRLLLPIRISRPPCSYTYNTRKRLLDSSVPNTIPQLNT